MTDRLAGNGVPAWKTEGEPTGEGVAFGALQAVKIRPISAMGNILGKTFIVSSWTVRGVGTYSAITSF